MKKISVALLLFGFAAVSFLPGEAECSYSYVDIHPAGWIESRATCINSRGEIAGYGIAGSGESGFLYSNGTVTEILPPGASDARAHWVNGRGDVAGTAVIGGRFRAFLFEGGVYIDPTPGWAYSEAFFVGEDGTVAGSGELGGYIFRDGVLEILPAFSAVVGVNSAGQIVGSADNTVRIFLPGTGYLNVNPPGVHVAAPRDINESGIVAMNSVEGGSERGFVYSGGFYVFMTPPGWSSSNAMGINNRGQVVGYGASPAGTRSFLRTGNVYEEVSFPGWPATEAVSVNDLGMIAGSGQTDTGATRAFAAMPAVAHESDLGASPGPAAGGGCSMAAGQGGRPFSGGSLLALLVLFSPGLAILLRPLFLRACAAAGRIGAA